MQSDSTTEINFTSLTIRKLDLETKERLRQLAASHGHSMEEEARRILRRAVTPPTMDNAFDALRRSFAVSGGVELELPTRQAPRKVPDPAA